MIEISNNLFIFRKKARMRQRDLAEKIGSTEQTISKYETGRLMPTIPTMVDIARILGVDASEIWPDVFAKPISK